MTIREMIAIESNKLMARACDHVAPDQSELGREECEQFDLHLKRIRDGEFEPDWYNTK